MQRKKNRSGRTIPLNCVDKCLLALDGINEPMLTHAILNLEGEIDHARLNQAILSAQEAFPIMRTVLRGKHFRLFREIQEALGEGVLTVQELASKLQYADIRDAAQIGAQYGKCLCDWLNRPLDIRQGFPLRVVVLRKSELETSLIFTFHHSVADGLRAVLFIRWVIEGYNNEVPSDSPLPEDPRIHGRGDELLEFANSQRSRVEHYYVKMIVNLFRRFAINAVPPPTRVFHDRPGGAKEIGYYSITLNPAELEQIELRSRSAGVELNDLLLAACYRVVEKWNGMHGKVSKKIRIMAPVNVSPKGFRRVVSNQASWISPVTTPQDRADPARLLKQVRADSIYAAKNRMAFSLIYFFYFCSRFPIVVMRAMCRFLMITRTYVDTILITNLGLIWPKPGADEPIVTRIGGARIVNVSGVAPVVTPMGLSVCAGIYNKKLNISLSYRPALFSKEKAQMFLDVYVDEIKSYQLGSERS